MYVDINRVFASSFAVSPVSGTFASAFRSRLVSVPRKPVFHIRFTEMRGRYDLTARGTNDPPPYRVILIDHAKMPQCVFEYLVCVIRWRLLGIPSRSPLGT